MSFRIMHFIIIIHLVMVSSMITLNYYVLEIIIIVVYNYYSDSMILSIIISIYTRVNYSLKTIVISVTYPK